MIEFVSTDQTASGGAIESRIVECPLCGSERGTTWNYYSKHLENEHDWDDLQFDAAPPSWAGRRNQFAVRPHEATPSPCGVVSDD